jgi:hypothetical protein
MVKRKKINLGISSSKGKPTIQLYRDGEDARPLAEKPLSQREIRFLVRALAAYIR